MNERNCGRLGKHTVSSCAERAAAFVVEYAVARAVCIAPDGTVTVEAPDHVIDNELVGVYTAERGHFELWRQISIDLDETVRERRIAGGTHYKHRAAVTRKVA
ncbi:hypothetical protein [Xylophilus sp.]|uniref:hypothetical protein n=1 Tax=Xylophilus sp. TaxID=2653893 RepID=UPI0013B6882E|nr:hypothetical protein [Xylophilus sp.]KAF1045649.1 MAG: hypothetical protein GAK38_02941 [Xylophilus sp.]